MTESLDEAFVPSGYQFVDDINAVDVSGAIAVRVSSGLLHKRDLFQVFSTSLSFPKYFGWNWDAFEECLCDLSWIKSPKRVLILHESLPFQPDWDNRGTYLEIIEYASSHAHNDGNYTLKAVFPNWMKREVLLGDSPD